VSVVTKAWDDDELFTALPEAIRARQAVPEEFVQAAKNAFTWHDIDADLAQLTFDSTQGCQSAATRSDAASVRALTFTSPRLTIELEVTRDSLLGQVVPAQQATVEVQTQAGAKTTITSDEIGCFAVQPLPLGSFRLRCQATGGIDVLTGWVTLLT
jgi:hypothetical protein